MTFTQSMSKKTDISTCVSKEIKHLQHVCQKVANILKMCVKYFIISQQSTVFINFSWNMNKRVYLNNLNHILHFPNICPNHTKATNLINLLLEAHNFKFMHYNVTLLWTSFLLTHIEEKQIRKKLTMLTQEKLATKWRMSDWNILVTWPMKSLGFSQNHMRFKISECHPLIWHTNIHNNYNELNWYLQIDFKIVLCHKIIISLWVLLGINITYFLPKVLKIWILLQFWYIWHTQMTFTTCISGQYIYTFITYFLTNFGIEHYFNILITI